MIGDHTVPSIFSDKVYDTVELRTNENLNSIIRLGYFQTQNGTSKKTTGKVEKIQRVRVV